MLTKNRGSSIPELIKRIRHSFRQCDFDEVQKTLMDGEKSMKVQVENLVRERDSLKNELDSLQSTQGFTELEKCSAEEKLGRSERRCEELDKLVVQMREEIENVKSEKSDLVEKMIRFSRKSEKNDENLVKMEKEIDRLKSEKLDLVEKMVRCSRKSEKDDERLVRMKKEIDRLRSEKLDLEEKMVMSSKEKDESLSKMDKEIKELRRENVNANKSIEEFKAKVIEAHRVVKELKRENVEAVKTIDELRAKKIVPDKAAELYERNLGHSERTIAKIVNVNVEDLGSLANGTYNFAAAATDAEVEENANHFIKSPEVPATSGAGNLAHSGTKEDGANTVCTSKPASSSAVAENNAIVQDNEGQEVRGSHASVMQSSGGEVGAKKTAAASPSGAGNVVITVSDSDDDDEDKRDRRRESAINRSRKRKRNTSTTSPSAFHNVEYVDLEDGPSSPGLQSKKQSKKD